MNTPSRCPECGTELPRGLPVGLCPVCALQTGTAPTAAPDIKIRPGDSVGRYKLLQQIGEGGCGVIFMAEQEEPIRRKVALKVIKLGMDTRNVVARFEAERQALALMDHPNIARVLDAGATETGRPYFVMELVRGVKITDYCDQHKLTTRARLDLFAQVCHAIQHAHQKGIIHRDIKPSNVLVTLHDGLPVPKVIDFGIAKATSDQRLTDKTLFTAFEQFMGTPAYMSPEQAEMSGLDIDTRSDIYSLGVLLYELLTGLTPFDGKELLAAGFDEMRRTIREKEPAKPSTRLNTMLEKDRTEIAKHRQTEPNKLTTLLRGDLDWIVMKALEKERKRRYETASSLAADIQRHLRNEPVVACPPTSFYRLQKMVQRNKLAFAATAALATVLLLGGVISAWQAVRATRAERWQSRLRTDAEQARATAQIEARRAQTAALEAKRTLAASDFLQAVRFIAEDKGGHALAFLARSLSGNPTNDAALTRLASWLTYHSAMLPILNLGHGSSVQAAQFSADGRQIVTASDHTARVWDADTGQPLTEPMKHQDIVNSAQFSPDGQRIVTASEDRTARVWDARTGQPLTEPMKHEHRVHSAQFSPDGKRIVTASSDKTAQIWDTPTGLPLTGPLTHAGTVLSAQFSPDGKRIVTASQDNTARVWDARSGQPLTEPMKHGPSNTAFVSAIVGSAQFSPDGTKIVTASWDKTARIWDAQTGRPLTEPMKHGARVRSARFSPDGKRIVTASHDHTARVWDVQTGQPLTDSLKHGYLVVSAQFSPDGKQILTASLDKTARVWDAETGQPLAEPMTHGESVYSAQFSSDGKRILTASSDQTARVWGARTAPALSEPMKHGNWVNSAQFSPDGKRIVTASLDNTARVWDAQTGQPLTEPMKHRWWVMSVEFSPDGKRIVTTTFDGVYSSDGARVWDAQTGQLLTGPMNHGTNNVPTAHFSPEGNRIVTASWDGTARVWDAHTGQLLMESMKHGASVQTAQFSPDGKRIVTASSDRAARVLDAESGQPLTRPMMHREPVYSAEFSPDGRRMVTASQDETARVWDAKTGQPLTDPLRHAGRVLSAQFSPDGKRVITTSDDQTVRVWDAETGRPLTEPLKHGDVVWSAQFSPDGKRIVTASDDNTVRVWDAQSGQPLTEPMRHGGRVRSAQFSPDGKRIVTGSSDKTARVWDVAPSHGTCPDWLIPLSEAISGQVLNEQGVLAPSKLNGAETLKQIRQRLNQEAVDNDWVVWGRWLLTDPATRTISPFSKLTVPKYIEDLIQENNLTSRHEAEALASGNSELRRRISEAKKLLEQTK